MYVFHPELNAMFDKETLRRHIMSEELKQGWSLL